ncbi:hypothetical protein TanjilG_00369 [Lupinus angustifolius]|uniref:Pectinesterase inhibitor domain-containing protein n=1 Tax=Lupinus angustifolius TaxID=3871 RepID=A0A1J7FPX9_LUPAN|nr:hypothetical protein TanjilG_00368 [Lupinus angustifolius]OIV89991.1 hypothetical protein TanjilG_00369 [Lupinus angustifolius]
MAYYFSLRPSLISCTLLTFLLFAESTFASKIVDVNLICEEVENPSFCSKFLNSKPGGAKGADLGSLANYTVEVAFGNITKTVKLIKSLIARSGKDREAKSHYEVCLIFFSEERGSLGGIMETQKRLEARDYFGVITSATSVVANIEYCISGDDPQDPPYPDKSKLPRYARFIEQVVEIILVISKYLTLE